MIIGTLLLLPSIQFSSPPITPSAPTRFSFSPLFPCQASLTPALDGRRKASLYEVLRLNQNASPIEIKTAYRSLAKMYHPDSSLTDSNGRDFMNIHNAYATLSDPSAREMYDLTLRPSFGGRRSGGFYTTRRWETDQCW